MDIEEEERALGRWPRRLLHVPTLRSYPWQPGNIYNNIKEPAYNALTYTWGHYRLHDSEFPEVHAIPITIDGGSWDIPRINPSHFTSDEFEAVVRKAGTFSLPTGSDSVQFLWLDIACIDQREREPQSAAEIGRQGAIFEGARHVFAWLTTHTSAALTELMAGIISDNAQIRPHPSRIQMQHMTALLSDPWFSSLWTLQETFLRGEALLVSRGAELAVDPTSGSGAAYEFGWLAYVGTRWLDECTALLDSRPSGLANEDEVVFARFVHVLETAGLTQLYSWYPLATYAAAQHRVASRPEDRIYGIQQIFGFRVGKSGASARPGQTFDAEELDELFGEQMLLRYPTMSQFHRFTRHVAPSRRWRLDARSMVVVESLTGFMTLPERAPAPPVQSKFWVDHDCALPKPVCWSGLTTPFVNIKRMWEDFLASSFFSRTPNMILMRGPNQKGIQL